MPRKKLDVFPGNPQVSGVTSSMGAVNFTFEAEDGAKVCLLLYRKHRKTPTDIIPLGESFRTGRVFSVRILGLEENLVEYNYQVDGKLVQDPHARRILGRERFGVTPRETDPHKIRCAFPANTVCTWQESEWKDPDYQNMILYKVHVRGFTRQRTQLGGERGTFKGLEKMIPYLQELGVNALELMPAYEFEELPKPEETKGLVNMRTGPVQVNYWGYGGGYYMAPKSAYCATSDPETEFRDLVRRLHEAGIACIMEFYFSRDISPMRILHILHHWKMFYHVDGFHLVGDGVPLETILRDGLLAHTLIMAVDYDTDTLYGGRTLPRRTFARYHAGFLEDMRRLLKSDEGMVSRAKYHLTSRDPRKASIHFMAYQDGFTLYDAVSYNYRHNEANGEDNADGTDFNYSWNCGVEGSTRKAAVNHLRLIQMRNAFALLLLSQEVPMIYSGDEIANSQKGNNNAYCQDNTVGWLDWKGEKRYGGLRTFVQKLIAFRKDHPILHLNQDLSSFQFQGRGFPPVSFHGERAWFCSDENSSRLLGVMYVGPYVEKENGQKDDYLYVGCNFHWEGRRLALPDLPDGFVWKKQIDTGDLEGDGFVSDETIYEKLLPLAPRSVVVLKGFPGRTGKEAQEEK